MSDFNLKMDVDIDYDKEKDVYVFGGFGSKKHKKLTSRAFSCLLGSNPFESIGKTILERFRLTERTEIDEYWSVRGDIAELLVLNFLKNTYKKKGITVELKTWDKEKVSYDNFATNKKFGGLLDIAIASPKDHRAVVEVKSKSMKDFEKIRSNRGKEEEVLQGKFLTFLSNVKKCLMIYVFFTPNQERLIKEHIAEKNENNQHYKTRNFAKMVIAKIGLEYTSVKITVFKYDIEQPKELEKDMLNAYSKLETFKKTKSIPSKLFNQNELTYLKMLTDQDESPF